MKLFELGTSDFNDTYPRKVDSKIIRGSRPLNQKAIDQLKDMGVKTVICLLKPARIYSSEINGVADEKPAVEKAGMDFFNIGMDESKGPTDADIAEFLDLVRKSKGPVYLHCSAGRDRAGLMTAIYDVEVRGRNFDQAYEDFIRGGHAYMSWPNLDRFFYRWYQTHHDRDANPLAVLQKLNVKYAEDLAKFITK